MPSRSILASAAAAVIQSLLAVAVVAPSRAAAQVSGGADLGARMQQQSSNDYWQSVTRIDPTLRVDGRWLQITGNASLVSGALGGARFDHGTFSMLGAAPAWGPFRLTTTATMERESIMSRAPRTFGLVESALSFKAYGGGFWVGAAGERAYDASANAPVQPLFRAGFWHQFGSLIVSLSADQQNSESKTTSLHSTLIPGDTGFVYFDTLSGTLKHTPASGPSTKSDTVTTLAKYSWANVQARADWSLGNIYFDTKLGIQQGSIGSAQSYWANATAAMPVRSGLSLVAGAGKQPANVGAGIPAQRYATLGFRVSPPSLVRSAYPPEVRPDGSSFALQRLGAQRYVVTVRVPGARAVDLSGDFDSWKPIALRQVRPDVWESVLALAPGTYHVNMRVNGDHWTAPPGMPSVRDDFNGDVGLLVVR